MCEKKGRMGPLHAKKDVNHLKVFVPLLLAANINKFIFKLSCLTQYNYLFI